MASPAARRRSEIIILSGDSDEEIQVLPAHEPRRQPNPVQTPDSPPQEAAPAAQNFAHHFAMDDFFDFHGGVPGGFPDDPMPHPPPSPVPAPARTPPLDNNHGEGGEYLIIDGEEVFIPNSRGLPARPASPLAQREQPHGYDDGAVFTVDECLQHVLAIFPDVSHEHVHQLYQDIESLVPGPERVENIVNKLLSAESYPKRDKGKQKKRKRDEEMEEAERKRWEGPEREAEPNHLKGTISSMLKAEFPEATHNLISELMQTHRHLYPTYVALAKSKDRNDTVGWKGRAPKGRLASADTIALNSGWDPLYDELRAARKQVERTRADRRADDAKKQAEQENLQRAIEAGETAECQACFEELPMNRQIHCNGDIAHFTCFDCAETYIKSEVGDSRCSVLCTAGCGSGFAHAQLHRLADKQLLSKLEQLQQEKDIREAGLDDLEECPFCDFKMVVPPLEEDFEFRCMNSLCEKTSCRRCRSISHVPQSCEEYAKDNKLSTRHKIEEAMTAAMIRSCNKCKKQFIKEYGCNKMSCPSCGNLQCYCCSESLKGYDHFDQNPGYGAQPQTGGKKKCPLYDNVEERHEREVKEAEAAARAQVMSENPDVTEKDLEIKVSDAVQKATRDRIQRGAQGHGGMPVMPPAPADLGGLFAGIPRLGRFFAQDGANDDEDFGDEDEAFFGGLFDAPPVRRRNPPVARARVARMANALAGDQDRLAPPAPPAPPPAPAADPFWMPHHIPADPRLRHQHAALQANHAPARPAQAPANPAPVRMQGFIPVFGFGAQPAAQPPANRAQRQEQPQPPAAAPLGDGFRNRLQQHFGVDPFADIMPAMPAFPGHMAPAPAPQRAELVAQEQRRRMAQYMRQQQLLRAQRNQGGPGAG